ncbi:MAG: ABC transporter permease [Candidatus Sungiibacteriota bacterium]|uniref:Cell division protein FtsX n=1 Tax=Candidatus Sungiibacteriota bacterium TaxID=2750080 RepID=A0A7T5USB6_9BACT|nr:MAG: ABC transporter permease [Candidatus Sungbacteria bacterium]
MFKVTLRRIFRSGYLSFRRNGWLSTATVLVLSLVLFVLGNLIFVGALANTVLSSLESKIDISVYFTTDAPEQNILAVKRDIESLSDVSEVSYVSRDRALEEFRERHKNNALIAGALDELGDNPLQASLNIKARDPSNYVLVSDFLLKKNYPTVDKVNYFENQKVIERLGAILGTVRGGGAMLAIFLAFVAVLVAFNTVRLAIYTMREEIGIMRLVGATQWFIRGPFLVGGVLYGVVAAAATTLVFFPLIWLASPKISLLVPSFDLFQYFLSNFFEFFLIMLFAGILLGVTSSFIAIRRYLQI